MAQHKLRQPEMNLTKSLFVLLTALALLGCATNPDRNLDKRIEAHLEVQAIRSLLKGFARDTPNDENIGIIIGYEEYGITRNFYPRPATYIAYFKYRHDDESIVIHYHLFPVREKYSDRDRIEDNDQAFKSLLEKFAAGPSDAFFDGAKQLEMPLPKSLKNDSLLSKPYRKQKFVVFVDGSDLYYWGFKLKNMEFIQVLYMYPEKLWMKMEEKIIEPIVEQLVYHETPIEWFNEYEKERGVDADLEKRLKELGIKK